MGGLARLHAGQFARSAIAAGERLLPQVELRQLGPSSAQAFVGGGDGQDTALRDFRSASTVEFHCSCEDFAAGELCAHLWATVLAIDARLPKPAAAAPGAAPAATVGAAGPAAASRLGLVQSGSPAHPDEAMALAGNRLVDVASDRLEPAMLPTTLPVPRLEHHLEWRQLQGDEVLRVHTVALGPTGGALPTVLPRGLLARLPAAEQRLLALRHRQRRDALRRMQSDFGLGDIDLVLPWIVAASDLPEVLSALLPLSLRGRDLNGALRPLRLDCEPPFVFELAQTPGQQPGTVILHGSYRRGDERVALRAVAAVHPVAIAVIDDRLVRCDCGAAFGLVRQLASAGPMVMPTTALPGKLAELAALPDAATFLQPLLPDGPPSPPVGIVTVAPPVDGASFALRLAFDYDGVLVEGDAALCVHGASVRRRDRAAEASIRAQLAAAGVLAEADGFRCGRDELPAAITKLAAAGLRVTVAGQPLRPPQDFRGEVRTGIDWFAVSGEVQFAGATATVPELLRRTITPDGLVELGDGSFGLMPQQWVRRVDTLRNLSAGAGDGDSGPAATAATSATAADGVRIPKQRGLMLDALLLAADGEFAADSGLQQLQARLRAFERLAELPEPEGFLGKLRPYQRQGLAWLKFLGEFGLGGCLADDMGLGKTVQVLALLQSAHGPRATARQPSLLVAPRSLVGNWRAEAKRFAPGLRVLDFSQGDRWRRSGPDAFAGVDLVLTTYGTLRSDVVQFQANGQRFHWVVLDEAQAIKTADSQNAKAVRLLASDHRLALSGTPVENRVSELWSLFQFLNPGMLGQLQGFRALFQQGTATGAGAEQQTLLQRALRPVMLRRTKAQVLTELPPKTEQVLWCELEGPQRARYDDLAAHYRQRLLAAPADGKGQVAVLEALLRLRQAACHEGLLGADRKNADSAKFAVLLPALVDLVAAGNKGIVFSQFTGMLDLLEPELARAGLPFVRLDGSTSDVQRQARVRRFQQDGDCPLFLISLKAGGTGLNLTAASYVFLLDPWWNPAAERQAIDRAHRMGQQNPVFAYRLISRGTVEERVLELQQQKRVLGGAVLGDDAGPLQQLSRSDLQLLLGGAT